MNLPEARAAFEAAIQRTDNELRALNAAGIEEYDDHYVFRMQRVRYEEQQTGRAFLAAWVSGEEERPMDADEVVRLITEARALLLRASGRIDPENWWHEHVWDAHEAATVALDFVRDEMTRRLDGAST